MLVVLVHIKIKLVNNIVNIATQQNIKIKQAKVPVKRPVIAVYLMGKVVGTLLSMLFVLTRISGILLIKQQYIIIAGCLDILVVAVLGRR